MTRENSEVRRQRPEGGFRDALMARVLIADGAMGTMLMARRPLVNRSLDELNLSLPALVRDVHQEYLRAGAEILETNTFGANRARLAAFGFGERVRAVNQAGVRIAREAARDQAFVAGAVGPLGIGMAPLGRMSADEARALFREQIDALVSAGVDLLMLETFRDLEELHQAVLAARESAGDEMVVIAHVSVEGDGALFDGAGPEVFTRRMDLWPVDGIGVNCSSGPRVVLETIERMAAYTRKPLSAMPNAGLPATVDGRSSYLPPEYMARYAGRFLRAGVKIIGGCCGVSPEHVRAIGVEVREERSQRAEDRSQGTEEDRSQETEVRRHDNLPGARKSGLGEKLGLRQFVTLIEVLPPEGADASREIQIAREAKSLGLDGICMADRPRGLSAAVACSLIEREAGVATVLVFSSRGRGAATLQSELLGAQAAGIRNVLCVDGEGIDSIGLLHLVNRLNRGMDLGGNPLGSQTTLLAGVRVNPAAADAEEEMRRFEGKVGAGAEFVVTQPIFDAETVETFLRRVEPYGLPVIVGMRPLRSFRDAEFTMYEQRVPVPAETIARIGGAESEDAARAEGIAIAHETVERVRGMAAGVLWSGTELAALGIARELH